MAPQVRLSGAVKQALQSWLQRGGSCEEEGPPLPSSHCSAPHRLAWPYPACFIGGAAGDSASGLPADRWEWGSQPKANPTLLGPWPHSWLPGHRLHVTLEKWRLRAPAPCSQAEEKRCERMR